MERKLQKTISYRLQFINSARFMANSLSNLANNLVEGFIKLNIQTVIHLALNTQMLKVS